MGRHGFGGLNEQRNIPGIIDDNESSTAQFCHCPVYGNQRVGAARVCRWISGCRL
jgi:hypothetical protein